MNVCHLIGNLANDPEVRTTQSGLCTCSFRLAVQRRFKGADGQRETDFISIVAWRQTAELCAKYLARGRKVAVTGSLQMRSYQAQDGQKRTVAEVIADNVEFLTSRAEAAEQAQSAPQNTRTGQSAHQMGFTEVADDDDLPF